MESRRRKPKQLRQQVVVNTLSRSKSRVLVEIMPPLLEDPKENPDAPQDHLVFNCNSPLQRSVSGGRGVKTASVKRDRTEAVLISQYGNSGRWRLITAVPELSHQASSSRRKKEEGKKREGQRGGGTSSSGFGCGFFRAAVSACKACHAMEPSRVDNELLQETLV